MEYIVEIRGATLKEEFEYLKYVLECREFYDKHGYKVSYPDNEELRNPDILKNHQQMFSLLEKHEYDKSYYQAGLDVLLPRKSEVERYIYKLLKIRDYWNFKIFELHC